MHVECEQSKSPSNSVTDKPVKDRLALSALCNNASEHPRYNPYSSQATSPAGSHFSQNQSSSSMSSLRRNPLYPPSCLDDAPYSATSRRLPPISDLNLFNQHQSSVPETAVPENSNLSDGIRIPIDSRALHQFVYHDNHPPAPQIPVRKPCMTSEHVPYKVYSSTPSLSSSPPAFSHSSCAEDVLSNSPLPDVETNVFDHRQWSSPKCTTLPRSLTYPLGVSQSNSFHTRRRYPSQITARVCTNCGISETRQWVRGENHAWLCHSCGQFWRKNGYSRPRALWNRPTFKRSSRKTKLTTHGVEDTRRAKGSSRQTVSSSFLNGKKMIQLEACLPRLHSSPVAQNVVNGPDGLTTR